MSSCGFVTTHFQIKNNDRKKVQNIKKALTRH
jgi:hypothetical protein